MKFGAVGLLFMHLVALCLFAGGIYLSFAVFLHWWPTVIALVLLLPAELAILHQRTKSRGFRIPGNATGVERAGDSAK